jgi:hypothetical protein
MLDQEHLPVASRLVGFANQPLIAALMLAPPLLLPQSLRMQPRMPPVLTTPRTQQPVLATKERTPALHPHQRCRRNPTRLVIPRHSFRVLGTPRTLIGPLFSQVGHDQPANWPRAGGRRRRPADHGRTTLFVDAHSRLRTDCPLRGLVLAMRMRGLEPPRGCPHTDLNRARLPIPPHPRGRTV